MLSIHQLSFSYAEKRVLSKINFSVKKGQHIALMGKSGCGKSTLLRVIYGLLDIEIGNITYYHQKLLGPKFHLVPGHAFMKYLSQDLDIMPFTSVAENIGDFLSNFYPIKKKKRIEELLEVVGMIPYSNTKVKFLSGGQKQRVALARVLALEPEILLLDEPFSQIDNFKKHQLRYQLFEYIKEKQITCITATHDKDDVLPFADKVLILKNGAQISFKSPLETYVKPDSSYTASLFSEITVFTENELKISSSKTSVIVYPNQIQISENGWFTATVEACYFRGNYYMLHLNFNAKRVLCSSLNKISENEVVKFKVIT